MLSQYSDSVISCFLRVPPAPPPPRRAGTAMAESWPCRYGRQVAGLAWILRARPPPPATRKVADDCYQKRESQIYSSKVNAAC